MSYGLPTIRLELDVMKYHVMHALTTHNEEIEKAVEEQIKSAIESIDMTTLIKETLRSELREIVKRSLEHEIREVTYNPNNEVSLTFRRMIRESIRKVIDESPTL